MFQLEKYQGLKSRHRCPNCHRPRVFARYVNWETGNYVSAEVGRCNRESSCGYHFTPKMFFEANPEAEASAKLENYKSSGVSNKNLPERVYQAEEPSREPDYIDSLYLQKTLSGFEHNPFVLFLTKLFPEDSGIVCKTVKKYLIGRTRENRTVFWQVDKTRQIRTGKIISYNPETGKRNKDAPPSWIHAELKRQKLLPEDFNLSQCFFGEHLLCENQSAPVAIVEAEKTAVIASICFPEFIWLAAGSKLNLKTEKLQKLSPRKIILYPDADGFDRWREIAQDARSLGLSVKVSTLIETCATSEQKANGYDLADYLIEEQQRINTHNFRADRYNFALEQVLTNEFLLREFNRAFDAQKANLILYGGIDSSEAEVKVSDPENVRQLVFKTAARQIQRRK